MESRKTSIIIIILATLILGCGSNENVDEETEKLIKEELQLQNKIQEKLNSFDQRIEETLLIKVEIADSLKISNELKEDPTINKGLEGLIDDKFINDKFRYDLLKVIGHSAKLKSTTNNIKVYNVQPFNYLKDKPKPKITYPNENGLLSELKITNKMTSTLNFFGIKSGLTNEEIYYGTVSETANLIIDDKLLDLPKIKRQFTTEESRKGVELITMVTVTEFLHKKYTKRERKIKVKEFPLIKSGVSLGKDFFTENSFLKRTFKVSIETTPIDEIISRTETGNN